MALNEGQLVGPYQVIGPLGQGGMASVYKAYHARLDRHVAIKMLHKTFLEQPDFLSRFEREAQIVAKLEHPHIVPVYDFDEHDGQPYLVMKFVEGQTLKKVLSRGPLPLERVISIMDTMAGALTYAHEQGVLHRDIKPSNILIDPNGVPYLTDFGLARIVTAGTSTMSADMILGTPQYISPEQASGQGELSSATDVYSLGVILYEMVVGRVPFTGDTPYAVVHDHIYTELPRPSEINPAIPTQVEAVLVKALAKKPADRYSSPNAMMQAFHAACHEAGLITLPADRDKTAEQSFTKRVQDVNAASIPSPIPPRSSQPRVSVRDGRQVEWELNFDSENWKQIGERVKQNVEKGATWVEGIAASIEQAAKDGNWGSGTRDPKADMTPEERLEYDIRKRMEKRFEERQGLIGHAIPYFVVNAVLWFIWLSNGAGFPWPIFVTFFWGIGFVLHFLDYYHKYGPGVEKQEEAIRREIERARELSGLSEKPKNDVRMRLTDDGELEALSEEDEISRELKRKRR
ncbi:MAG: protein kinase [Anaerolineae bacterium]|nr:protein kinase [Anaerolineae bacterium]